MADLTYTATGKIDVANRLLILELRLPLPPPENPYEFNFNVDLSRMTLSKGQINAVFCHFKLKDDPGLRLTANMPSDIYPLKIEIDKLIKYNSKFYKNFDVSLNDTLFILFHDNESLDLRDTDLFHENIELLYELTKVAKDENDEKSHNLELFTRPRAIGMSIIKKP